MFGKLESVVIIISAIATGLASGWLIAGMIFGKKKGRGGCGTD